MQAHPVVLSPATLSLPLYTSSVSAGFPSPADDHLEAPLDLNEHLVKHPAATFVVKVDGDSMTGAGIYNGDLLVVDRSLDSKSGSIVVAVVNGELTVKRLWMRGKRVRLLPENPAYPPIEIGDGSELVIWGGSARRWRALRRINRSQCPHDCRFSRLQAVKFQPISADAPKPLFRGFLLPIKGLCITVKVQIEARECAERQKTLPESCRKVRHFKPGFSGKRMTQDGNCHPTAACGCV